MDNAVSRRTATVNGNERIGPSTRPRVGGSKPTPKWIQSERQTRPTTSELLTPEDRHWTSSRIHKAELAIMCTPWFQSRPPAIQRLLVQFPAVGFYQYKDDDTTPIRVLGVDVYMTDKCRSRVTFALDTMQSSQNEPTWPVKCSIPNAL